MLKYIIIVVLVAGAVFAGLSYQSQVVSNKTFEENLIDRLSDGEERVPFSKLTIENWDRACMFAPNTLTHSWENLIGKSYARPEAKRGSDFFQIVLLGEEGKVKVIELTKDAFGEAAQINTCVGFRDGSVVAVDEREVRAAKVKLSYERRKHPTNSELYRVLSREFRKFVCPFHADRCLALSEF